MSFYLSGSCQDLQMIETDSVYKTKSFGFSQAVVSQGFVFTSGQVGWDIHYKLKGKRCFKAQAMQSFRNIELILQQVGSSLSMAVQLRIYVTNISPANKKIVTDLIKKHFPGDFQPATTFLCVNALARKELMIEVEALAVLAQSKCLK